MVGEYVTAFLLKTFNLIVEGFFLKINFLKFIKKLESCLMFTENTYLYLNQLINEYVLNYGGF